jgi:heat shock protein HspQ
MEARTDNFDVGRGVTPLPDVRLAKFAIGDVVKHRVFAFRGVIFDVDPTFSNTEEWWLSIPENIRPRKDQPSRTCSATTAASRSVTPRRR